APEVVVHEHPVAIAEIVARAALGFDAIIAGEDGPSQAALRATRAQLLDAASRGEPSDLDCAGTSVVSIDPTGEVSVLIGADILLREQPMHLVSEAQVQ